MTSAAFRKLALSLPEATEQSHMSHPDFRVRGKIFATMSYPDATKAMVKLSNMQQDTLVHAFPKMFAPVPGKWGENGATHVTLRHATRPRCLTRCAWGGAQ
jgi:hypothetical protein